MNGGKILPLVGPEKISIVCHRVEQFDDPFQETVDNLVETLLATGNGVGLAAPQVGYEQSVAVIRPYLYDFKRRNESIVIVNPSVDIKPWTPRLLAEEGCLSFPGRFEPVYRAKSITLTAADRLGVVSTIKVHGWLARIIQHEVDHLNGLICFDKAAKFETLPKEIKNKRRKYARTKKE